jgi:Tfp pilus tip-associated adhesin PilY1
MGHERASGRILGRTSMVAALRLCIALCALAWPGLARAQTAPPPNDSDYDLLFQQTAPPPNVALLFDDSGSMAQIVWRGPWKNSAGVDQLGFEPKKFYDNTDVQTHCTDHTDQDNRGRDRALRVRPIPNSAGKCPNQSNLNDTCPNTDTVANSQDPGEHHSFDANGTSGTTSNYRFSCVTARLKCTEIPWVVTGDPTPSNNWTAPGTPAKYCVEDAGSARTRIWLPDYSTGNDSNGNNIRTEYSKNYVAYLLQPLLTTATPAVTPKQPIPFNDRLNTIKAELTGIIKDFNPPGEPEQVRFALFSFNDGEDPNGTSRFGRGAEREQMIGAGTQQQMLDKIAAMTAEGGTPLAESLVDIARYLSGNQAIGVSSDLASGTLEANDPMSAAYCAKNFAILLTDGAPSSDNFAHMTTFPASIGDPNSVGAQPPAGQPPYQSTGTDWLDDVTRFIHENDLRPADMQGASGSAGLAGKQNIMTYIVGFSIDHDLLDRAATAGGTELLSVGTGEQLKDALTNAINDILALSGTFSAASIPSTRANADEALFSAYFEPSSESNFWPGHLQMYKVIDDPNIPGIDFTVKDKNGDTIVNPVTGEFTSRDTAFWDAASCLTTLGPCYVTSRSLYFNWNGPTRLERKPFDTTLLGAGDFALTAADLDDFSTVAFPTTDAAADALIGYVSGLNSFSDTLADRTKRRAAVLGDIFHSGPASVGGASFFLLREPGYGVVEVPPGETPPPSFFDQYYTRDRVLYVGSNGGMLHGFDAGQFQNPNGIPLSGDESYTSGSGSELFGYIARDFLPTLKNLAKKDLRSVAKPFFMDGSPVVADAWLPSTADDVTKDPNEWTTVLVSGMRNGGDAVLALDITDPKSTVDTAPHGAYPKLLWEFDDPDKLLGKTWSTPVITRLKLQAGVNGDFCGVATDGDGDSDGPNGLADKPDCQETWVAIFGGGYLEQSDPSLIGKYLPNTTDAGWVADSRSLYIVRLKTGEVLSRVAYDPSPTSVLNKMRFSVASSPAVADLNADGFADVVYFGDVGGQLWKWDISAVASPAVSADPSASKVGTDQWPIGVFFEAPQGENGHYRQIFQPPSLSRVNGVLHVAFGTGERARLTFPNVVDKTENHFYVIRDLEPIGPKAFVGTPYRPSNLTPLKPGDAADTKSSDSGFYLVGRANEKFVTESIAFGGQVITLSYTPDLDGTQVRVCEEGGNSSLYIFSLADGTGFFKKEGETAKRTMELGGGLPTNPRISQMGESSHVVVQTSKGRLHAPTGVKTSKPAVDWIFWRENQ